MEKYVVSSPEETRLVAQKLADRINGPTVIAYFGGLGAGKTTFSRFLCQALGSEDEVTSPTFAMVHEYSGRLPIYHFDMYRVDGYEGLYSTGYFDYLDTGVLLIEWSENIEEDLPHDHIRVEIRHGATPQERIITIGENQ
ncbi:MAG: tRNA (adenosine(37)-N6)-threonylcarbamoyltransferase complex ATPase subunit type 1 TsaE [Clostridia bacterium]|nr:tRNA (adenosine(37)-N6)-threonylcarbamoyltransferase complex ATPase subunit type 1 TsaE [Clostridia bacterium]